MTLNRFHFHLIRLCTLAGQNVLALQIAVHHLNHRLVIVHIADNYRQGFQPGQLCRVLPPVAFTIPLYIMFNKLGILNTKLPVLLACVLINVPLIIWFLISFFQDLPEEVEESAKVDGATEWQLFRKIVLPLVAPGIAAVSMLSFMYAWNEYTYTVIFTRIPANNTVPLALALLNTEDNLTNFGLVAAGGVISVIPITLFVIFAQNYLISGLSSGAVKE